MGDQRLTQTHKLIIALVAAAQLLAAAATAETEMVTRIVDQVRDAIDDSAGDWQLLVDAEEDRWKTVEPTVYLRDQESRLRCTVTIPPVFAGAKIEGGRALLHLSISGPVDHLVVVHVDGDKRAEMPEVDSRRIMHYRPILLTEEARSGTAFQVELVIINPGIYPPHEFLDASRTVHFNGATLELEAATGMRQRLVELEINLETGIWLTRPWQPHGWLKDKLWLDHESRSRIDPGEQQRLRTVLNQAAARLDLEALAGGDSVALDISLAEVYQALKPVGDLAKQFTIYCVGNAHIDLAWLWRTNETTQIAANTFRSALNNMEEFPAFIFAQSQAQAYQWVEETDPELLADIQAAVARGSWDVVGGMWAEPDCNIPGGESWVRQFLYAQRYFKERFSRIAELGWNPDSFGYSWNMPQLYTKAGIKAFITQKISWNDTTVFPYHLFWWQGPDGSRILTYFPTGSYTEKLQPSRLVDQMMRFERSTGRKQMLVLFGIGNHGGGPNRPMLERFDMLARQPVFPNLEYSTGHAYIERLLAEDLSDLPVWRDELYMEGHRGTLTTQAKTKLGNRRSESLLESAEKLATIASLHGKPYPRQLLEKAWKLLLLNQFHDILPGSSITPVFRDAERDHALIARISNRVVDRAVQGLAEQISIPDHGWRSALVCNPLSWRRDDLVHLPLPDGAPTELSVYGPDGSPVPAAILTSDDGLDRTLVFVARGVPGLGYQVHSIREGKAPVDTNLKVDGLTIENRYLRVTVNPKTGNLSSIFDRLNQRQVLAAGEEGNRLELHENLPSFWDAWNIGYTGRSWVVDQPDAIEVIDRSPLCLTIRVKKSFLGLSKANRAPTEGFPSSFFTQEITVWAGRPQVDMTTEIDWWEDHTLLKVAFPFAVTSDTATYEIPYASIERSTRRESRAEKARFEYAVHRWADIGDGDWGVSLLNDSKYGIDTHDNRMRLTLLTSALWPDPLADRGVQRCAYSVYPHAGSWRQADSDRRGQELNIPLVVRLMTPKLGELDSSGSFITVDGDGVALTALKPAEDAGRGTNLIVRLVEQHGSRQEVTVSLWRQLEQAVEVDFLEREIGEVPITGDSIKLVLEPHEIKSIRLEAR
jgi:alpha-mannosidase